MKTEHYNFLKTNQTCDSFLKWAESQSNLYELWNNCRRGDWLLWLAEDLQVDSKRLMLCGALCAHTAVHLMKDRRSREAVRIAFLYARGKATYEQLEEARYGALCAAAEAEYNADYFAALAAATTVDDASDANAAAAAIAAADVADTWAATLAATDDWAATAAAAREANQLNTAEITRKILTQEVFEKIDKI